MKLEEGDRKLSEISFRFWPEETTLGGCLKNITIYSTAKYAENAKYFKILCEFHSLSGKLFDP